MTDSAERNGSGESLQRRRMARIADVAALSGASTATVDRVLNQRPGVRPVTVQRVLKAALELGYSLDADLPANAMTPMRLGVSRSPSSQGASSAVQAGMVNSSENTMASGRMVTLNAQAYCAA